VLDMTVDVGWASSPNFVGGVSLDRSIVIDRKASRFWWARPILKYYV
jgi:hypothetical protein